MSLNIEQVNNGYVVTGPNRKQVFYTLDEVCEALLLHFEGRASSFEGNLYGLVVIYRDAPAYSGVSMVSATPIRPPLAISDDEAPKGAFRVSDLSTE